MPEIWLSDNSITDTEVALASRKGFVSKVTITESDERGGYYVTMRVKPHEEMIHLATRRVRDQPRIFMNLGRLIAHIRTKIMPLEEVRLVLVPTPKKTSEVPQEKRRIGNHRRPKMVKKPIKKNK
jgi:hypothetical protein